MPRPGQSNDVVRFSAYEVHLRAGELYRAGRKIRLQVQPFHVLAILLEHPGEVVAREELQKRLWPADTFVDFDHSLNTAIKKLRQALSDDKKKAAVHRNPSQARLPVYRNPGEDRWTVCPAAAYV